MYEKNAMYIAIKIIPSKSINLFLVKHMIYPIMLAPRQTTTSTREGITDGRPPKKQKKILKTTLKKEAP